MFYKKFGHVHIQVGAGDKSNPNRNFKNVLRNILEKRENKGSSLDHLKRVDTNFQPSVTRK